MFGGEDPQSRQEQGAAPDLVGLCEPARHDRSDLAFALGAESFESGKRVRVEGAIGGGRVPLGELEVGLGEH